MRLVHAADIHLDSPLRGLTRLGDDGLADVLRQATRRALENLVRFTVETRADALLLAGDVYDGDWRDYATGRFFADQMGRLHDENIRVFMIAGNHDAESEITRSLILPPNVTVLATDHPQTVTVADLGLAVHGQGFATRAVQSNLVRGYPEPIGGLTNVGLLHTALDGAEGHAPYAPCTPDDLRRTGYAYVALGHVHAHRVVLDGEQAAAFSGNLQGRHPRESGPKGALVVDLAADSPPRVRHEPLDVARWATLTLDVGACGDFEDVIALAERELRDTRADAGERAVVTRLAFTGSSPAAAALADGERLREQLELTARAVGVAVEKVTVTVTRPGRAEAVDPELMAAVVAAGAGLTGAPDRLAELVAPLEREVGKALRAAGLLDLRDPDTLAELAGRASGALAARLAGEER
jgi:DNA repair protein SbcD/Mre11